MEVTELVFVLQSLKAKFKAVFNSLDYGYCNL